MIRRDDTRSNAARPRQKDIARLAGVSQGTVSLVINGRDAEGRIPPETRDRVLEVARSLGYVPDPVARRLAGGRNRLIGVFTYESVFPTSQRDFYYPFLVGIEERAQQLGYDLVLFTGATAADGERAIYVEGQNRIRLADGAIILGQRMNRSEIIQLGLESYPFALIGRRDIPGAFPFVTADYEGGTVSAFHELERLGHTRIRYVAEQMDTEPARDRRQGFVEVATARSGVLDLRAITGQSTAEITAAVIAEADSGATAIVTHYAEAALDLIRALEGHGLRVPDDVSVIALNDPPLTADHIGGLRIPRKDMGTTAVDLLVARMDATAESVHRMIPTEFDPGTTVSAPNLNRRTR